MAVDTSFMDRMRSKQRDKRREQGINDAIDAMLAKMDAANASPASLMLVHGTYRAFCLDLSALAAMNSRPTDNEISDAFTNMLLKAVEGEEFSVIGERIQKLVNETAGSINEILTEAMNRPIED